MKLWKMGLWKVNGSYTVEAALLLPLLVAVIMAVMYAGFYMHDKVVLMDILSEITAGEAEAAIYGMDSMEKSWKTTLEDRGTWYFLRGISQEEADTASLTKEMNRRCMMFGITRCTISIFPRKIIMKVEAECMYKGFLAAPFLRRLGTVSLKCRREIMQPSEFARAYRGTGICMDAENGMQMLKQWIKEE